MQPGEQDASFVSVRGKRCCQLIRQPRQILRRQRLAWIPCRMCIWTREVTTFQAARSRRRSIRRMRTMHARFSRLNRRKIRSSSTGNRGWRPIRRSLVILQPRKSKVTSISRRQGRRKLPSWQLRPGIPIRILRRFLIRGSPRGKLRRRNQRTATVSRIAGA